MTTFAASLLFADVKNRFATEGPAGCSVVFGRREPTKQINQGTGRANRVVFMPGDPAGKMGTYEVAKLRRNAFGEKQVRSLFTVKEILTVYVWAVDASGVDATAQSASLNDEAKQYEACRLLHDFVLRAIYRSTNVGHGSLVLSNPQWVVDKTERVFGRELFFTVTIEAAVPDEPPAGAYRIVEPPQTFVGPTALETLSPPDPPVDENDGSDTTPTP